MMRIQILMKLYNDCLGKRNMNKKGKFHYPYGNTSRDFKNFYKKELNQIVL